MNSLFKRFLWIIILVFSHFSISGQNESNDSDYKILTVVIPQLLWLPLVRRNQFLLFVIAGGIIVGMWQERLMFTTSSLEHNYMPSSWGFFYPTFWDWAALAGTIGLFLTLFFLFLRFAPIVSLAEVREIVETEKSK